MRTIKCERLVAINSQGSWIVTRITPLIAIDYSSYIELVNATVQLFGTHIVFEGYVPKYVQNDGTLNVDDVDDAFIEPVAETKFLGMISTGNTTKRIKKGKVRLKNEVSVGNRVRYTSSNYLFSEEISEGNNK